MTGALHFQVHPCAAKELLIDPLPEGAMRDGAFYPEGARLTDLKELRDPGTQYAARAECAFFIFTFLFTSSFLSHLAYANDTTSSLSLVGVSSRLEKEESDVVPQLWRTCGPDQVRILHQCHLAAADEPVGPTLEDVRRYT